DTREGRAPTGLLARVEGTVPLGKPRPVAARTGLCDALGAGATVPEPRFPMRQCDRPAASPGQEGSQQVATWPGNGLQSTGCGLCCGRKRAEGRATLVTDAERVWQVSIATLRSQVADATWRAWFDGVVPVAVDESALRLA